MNKPENSQRVEEEIVMFPDVESAEMVSTLLKRPPTLSELNNDIAKERIVTALRNCEIFKARATIRASATIEDLRKL